MEGWERRTMPASRMGCWMLSSFVSGVVRGPVPVPVPVEAAGVEDIVALRLGIGLWWEWRAGQKIIYTVLLGEIYRKLRGKELGHRQSSKQL